MSTLATAALRQRFADYFRRHGHTAVKSAPLVPEGDPTLMFVNAGMVPFKDVFVGAEARPYRRATTCQKCMRVSGKHNDLEAVGRTARHHTFFEMLGNFSFGDYFKEEAIVLAWRFIREELDLPAGRLWVTVFGGAPGLPADDEARALWRKISGLPDGRILAKGVEDNFWSMGETGPCGPCTEIHIDQGQGPVTDADFDSGRVMEIWNNVFMQFDRAAGGAMQPLPAPSVDTGMGLERAAAVAQGADSNYHGDLFLPLLDGIAAACGRPYRRGDGEDDVSMRVIADHARATAFLVADGVQPGPEGRGYVMRRIMRRAIRHGRRLGFADPFLHRACAQVVAEMGAAYPELGEAADLIAKVAVAEEEGFRRTLDTGLRLLGDALATAEVTQRKVLPGATAFRLYDTYGFPRDLTETIAQEQGVAVDAAGFDAAMAEQQARSRGGEVGQEAVASAYKQLALRLPPVDFVGYPHEDTKPSERPGRWREHVVDGVTYLQSEVKVAALLAEGAEVDKLNGPGEVVLAPMPLYGESGGQAGDRGRIDGAGVAAVIGATARPLADLIVAKVDRIEGTLQVGDTVWAGYDAGQRRRLRAHHSATHLLHGALRATLGDHVKQAGSQVTAAALRFDFTHFAAMTPAEIAAVEAHVSKRVALDRPVAIFEMTYDEARARGAIALFGEKYADRVRVIEIADTLELCGGTHADRTSEMGVLLILQEQAVQSGVRRIVAHAGEATAATAVSLSERLAAVSRWAAGSGGAAPGGVSADTQPADHELAQALAALTRVAIPGGPGTAPPAAPLLPPGPLTLATAQALRDAWQGVVALLNARRTETAAVLDRFARGAPGAVLHQVAACMAAHDAAARDAAQAQRASHGALAAELAERAVDAGGTRLLCAQTEGLDAAALRELADALRARLGEAVVGLGNTAAGKATLLVAVSPGLVRRHRAGDLVRALAPLIAGRGGGRPDMAQAGGSDPAGLPRALARLAELVAAPA